MFHLVENNKRQRSLWPEYRRQMLPPGWRFTGISGSQEDCLRQVADAEETAVLVPQTDDRLRTSTAAPAATPDSPRLRAVAVPFPKPQATASLFVFPHAGSGSAAYHFLARACKEDPVEIKIIQYPGREMRLKEAPCEDMQAMIAGLAADVRGLGAERPFAFLGHSMGALVAYEFTRRLAETGGPLPLRLFLSGRQAPQRPGLNLPVDSMSDAAFLDAVGRRYNALPAELISNPEIMALVLPSLRADFKLMARYLYRPAAPLGVGLTLINGLDDPWVNKDSIGAWQAQSQQPIEQHWLPGGHFYMSDAVATVRQLVLCTLGLQYAR